MSNPILTGNVSFVNHEKNYIALEYEENGKKKSINGIPDEMSKSKAGKIVKKKHSYLIGDTVNFTIGKSARGDKMVATNIQFLYNNALDVLINKAKTENNFIGYLKKVEDKYFVKEIDSYIFFPTTLSPWQIIPAESDMNNFIGFSLGNINNKEKITASLNDQKFIPEFHLAEKAFKKQEIIEARVYKLTPHGIYLNIFGEKIQAKLAVDAVNLPKKVNLGYSIKIKISYLSDQKIVIEAVL